MSFGHSMWLSIQNHQQDVGILWALLQACCCCWTLLFSICGFCSWCHSLGMDAPGTAISLWKGMFRQLLGIQFGLFYVISRCLDWCLLVRWIERSRDSRRGLFYRDFDHVLSTFLFYQSNNHAWKISFTLGDFLRFYCFLGTLQNKLISCLCV